ncbi:MAG: queuine tRNA-ribosyltransferase [Thaumarchaeota archaeon]|nr:queuine tRNA-ribosyltransferase [Nitrososphaerota archaeon]
MFDERRQLSLMLDYSFGKGVSSALPKDGLKLIYSRKSGRVKQVLYNGKNFATMKPNGAIALSVYGATLLRRRKPFLKNCVIVTDDAAEFVRRGKSVFCKFVKSAGDNVLARSEVTVLDGDGRVLGVGKAIVPGSVMRGFKSGVAVKVREGSKL